MPNDLSVATGQKCQHKKSDGEACGNYAMHGDRFCKFHRDRSLSAMKDGTHSKYVDKLPDEYKRSYNEFLQEEPLELINEMAAARMLLKTFFDRIAACNPEDIKASTAMVTYGMSLIESLSRVAERYKRIQDGGIKMIVNINSEMIANLLYQCVFPHLGLPPLEAKRQIVEDFRKFKVNELKRGNMVPDKIDEEVLDAEFKLDVEDEIDFDINLDEFDAGSINND